MNPISRETPLADVLPLLPNTQPLLVRENASLRSAAVLASNEQEVDTFAVVDDRGILIGVLTVDALVEDVLADLIPEEFLPDMTSLSELLSAPHPFVKHRIVGEIMSEACSVTEQDTVETAIHRMHAGKLRGIPVVDGEGKVTVYLDLFDTLIAWMRSEPDNETEES